MCPARLVQLAREPAETLARGVVRPDRLFLRELGVGRDLPRDGPHLFGDRRVVLGVGEQLVDKGEPDFAAGNRAGFYPRMAPGSRTATTIKRPANKRRRVTSESASARTTPPATPTAEASPMPMAGRQRTFP